MIKIVSEKIKKNILDLHFQKNLVITSTSIIIAFTYLIGVGIAILTKQLQFDNFISIIVLITISIAVLGISGFFFFKSYYHIKNILDVIKELKLK